jgi:hypothetical protein
MSVQEPGGDTRWRCGGCGNLTRFDVVRSAHVTEYWHFDLAGEHEVEDARTNRSTVDRVVCRWCGRDDLIEFVARVDADPGTSPAASD